MLCSADTKFSLARPVRNSSRSLSSNQLKFEGLVLKQLSDVAFPFACRVWFVDVIVFAVALHLYRGGHTDFMFLSSCHTG